MTPLNGDSKVIYDKLLEIQLSQQTISTKVDERHNENKSAQKVIFDKLDILDNLPCATHAERMIWLTRGMKAIWIAFTGIVIGGIVLGLWINSLKLLLRG